jgi:tetratricopeptide (TPR) repeat protein
LKSTKAYLDAHHIEHCWFAYTIAPFILPADYGIPCKLLPTADTFAQMDIDVPATIDGPVLISDLTLSGYEYGTTVRNPYDSLFSRRPDATIDDGVSVFDGSFHFPLASSLQYVHESGKLLDRDPAGALREAQQAIAFAPNDFDPVMAMGDALRANGKKAEAANYYRQAREIAKRMEPSARKDWNAALDQRMASVK